MNQKVLLVANTDWYLYHFRLALARYLRQQGLEVVMVAPAGRFAAEIAAQGFRFVPWNVGRMTASPPGELRALNELLKIYRQEKPALAHHFTIKPVLYGSLAAGLAQVPAVVNSVTGLGYVFITGGWKGRFMRAFVLPFYRFAFRRPGTRVIFENGTDQATFLQQRLVRPGESVVIRGAGVDEEYFQSTPEPDGAQPPLVVFPSRMLLDKGLGTLVQAARILKNRHPVRIALVGDTDPGNPTTVSAQTIHDWEQEGLVEWWGFQNDMRSVYQNCHLVTLPSLGEGLPTVLIEAAACGRAIVATDVPGCRDVVKDGVNGLLVPVNQPKALAQALETLVSNPQLRAQMGSAGREIVLQTFTNQIVNSEIFQVYRALFDGYNSRHSR